MRVAQQLSGRSHHARTNYSQTRKTRNQMAKLLVTLFCLLLSMQRILSLHGLATLMKAAKNTLQNCRVFFTFESYYLFRRRSCGGSMLASVLTVQLSSASVSATPTKKMLSAMGEFHSQTFITPPCPPLLFLSYTMIVTLIPIIINSKTVCF